MSGIFITFEGGEGAGKSTQVKRLAEHLQAIGRTCTVTREPGGTSEAEDIRNLLVNGSPDRWTANAEALLNYAAREMHLENLIRPALTKGDIVISDRFMDSTRVYQCYAGGCSNELVNALEAQIVGATRPILTIIFDLDPVIGLKRASSRGAGAEDRYERKGLAFHHRLREGFREIADHEPGRCKVIDASRSIDEVAAAIKSHVAQVLLG